MFLMHFYGVRIIIPWLSGLYLSIYPPTHLPTYLPVCGFELPQMAFLVLALLPFFTVY